MSRNGSSSCRALTALGVMLACLAALQVTSVRAEEVAEAWRSPFGRPRSVSVSPSDGSCWAATGSSVMHVAADGSVLSQTNGLCNPQCVAADPVDGTCWVADTGNSQVVHLDQDAAEILRLGGFSRPVSLSVNSADGSCWVADTENDEVVHLAADGAELLRIGCYEDPSDPAVERCFVKPESVSVNPTDGSCWVADTGNDQVVHLAEDGAQLLRIGCYEDSAITPPVERCLNGPRSVAVNPGDASCWVVDTAGNYLVHLAEDGSLLWCGPCFSRPQSISVDPTDGSCWVADTGNKHLVHLDADGSQLLRQDLYYDILPPTTPPRVSSFVEPSSVSVDPTDGSVWVADTRGAWFVHLREDPMFGVPLLVLADGYQRQSGFVQPEALSVDHTDGTCWVADTGNEEVVQVTADTYELQDPGLRGSGKGAARSISVNPTDGTVWLAFSESNTVEHQLFDYLNWLVTENPSSDEFLYPRSISADPKRVKEVPFGALGYIWHQYCWVADTYRGRVARIHEQHRHQYLPPYFGALTQVLWDVKFAEGFLTPECVSVNTEDRSCWVADSAGSQVAHLNRDCEELWRKSCFNYPLSVSVNSADGSCWVADSMNDQVVHLAEDGAGLLRLGGFKFPRSVSADAGDGTCWVADTLNNQVVHLAENGTELWRGGSFNQPHTVCVNPTDGSCWVGDTGNDQVVHLVVTEGPPRASFDVLPMGLVGSPVYFTDLSSREPTSWQWEFGDGGTSEEQHASHVYLSAGSYDMTLTVSNAYGSDSETKPVLILGSFSDVAADHWACDEISACVEAGVVSGYPDGSYQPDAPVDRAQMAVYISRALAGGDGNVPPDPPTPSFPDVPATDICYKYIEYAVGNHVVFGYPDALYHPDYEVDRGQMAIFIARATATPTGEPGMVGYVPPVTPTFADVTPDPLDPYQVCYKYVEYIAAAGVTHGYPEGLYHPEYIVSRGFMAIYVARAFGLL